MRKKDRWLRICYKNNVVSKVKTNFTYAFRSKSEVFLTCETGSKE